MINYNEISDKEYIKIYDESVKYYDNYIKNLPKFETNELTETKYHPMHPTIYFQLIQVNGFMDMNGYTYQDYISGWEKRSTS